jgi:hypothetical protein
MLMTQEGLIQLMEAKGAKVTSFRERHNKTYEKMVRSGVTRDPAMDMRKGISLHVQFPNGWVLSLQAGGGTYCEPRGYFREYQSLEIAVWHGPGDMIPFNEVWGEYLKLEDQTVHQSAIKEALSGDGVSGWVSLDAVYNVAHVLAMLPIPPVPPGANLERDSGPWKM